MPDLTEPRFLSDECRHAAAQHAGPRSVQAPRGSPAFTGAPIQNMEAQSAPLVGLEVLIGVPPLPCRDGRKLGEDQGPWVEVGGGVTDGVQNQAGREEAGGHSKGWRPRGALVATQGCSHAFPLPVPLASCLAHQEPAPTAGPWGEEIWDKGGSFLGGDHGQSLLWDSVWPLVCWVPPTGQHLQRQGLCLSVGMTLAAGDLGQVSTQLHHRVLSLSPHDPPPAPGSLRCSLPHGLQAGVAALLPWRRSLSPAALKVTPSLARHVVLAAGGCTSVAKALPLPLWALSLSWEQEGF